MVCGRYVVEADMWGGFGTQTGTNERTCNSASRECYPG